MIIKDLSEDRVHSDKSEECIANYLKPSIIEKTDTIELLKDFLYWNYDGEIIPDYSINEYKCDFYIPEFKLALKIITYYDYNETKVDKKFQLNSYLEFEKNDIHLIQIFEDIYINKKILVESRLLNLFGESKPIYARKCVLKEFKTEKESQVCAKFIDENHTQGTVGSSYKFGLYYNDELVSVMTFGKLRKNLGQKGGPDDYELLRFCNKCGYSVVGSASKLFKHFIKTYNPVHITSYADKMWSSSENLYTRIGMQFVHRSDPSYFYIVGDVRKGRFSYRKNVLLECGYDGDKWGEHDICYNNKVFRIFDVGCEKMVWKKED